MREWSERGGGEGGGDDGGGGEGVVVGGVGAGGSISVESESGDINANCRRRNLLLLSDKFENLYLVRRGKEEESRRTTMVAAITSEGQSSYANPA